MTVARPLYQPAAREPDCRPPQSNAGLWYDKFCNVWRHPGWTLSADGASNPKLDWIETVTGAVGDADNLREAALRLLTLTRARGGQAQVFVTDEAFVTGLGRSHPVENGFAWHPTLGTPYLPGPSVKGMVRAWAEQESYGEIVDRLLGSQGQVGDLCFLDAVPTRAPRLAADVMTPHYGGWSAKEPPGDWRSPTPVFYLVTEPDVPFLFSVLPRRHGKDSKDVVTAVGWLKEALYWAGAGAKTTIGHGRFRVDELATEELAAKLIQRDATHARQAAMASPEGLWRVRVSEASEADILDLIRVNLEKDPLEDSGERRALAAAVRASGLLKYWREGERRDPTTQVGRRKLRERARLVDQEGPPPDGAPSA